MIKAHKKIAMACFVGNFPLNGHAALPCTVGVVMSGCGHCISSMIKSELANSGRCANCLDVHMYIPTQSLTRHSQLPSKIMSGQRLP